jgi:hypothetical protein
MFQKSNHQPSSAEPSKALTSRERTELMCQQGLAKVQDIILRARSSGMSTDWGELVMARHRYEPYFSPLCFRFSPNKVACDWYGALSTLGVSGSELELVREAARAQRREHVSKSKLEKGEAKVLGFEAKVKSIIETIRSGESALGWDALIGQGRTGKGSDAFSRWYGEGSFYSALLNRKLVTEEEFTHLKRCSYERGLKAAHVVNSDYSEKDIDNWICTVLTPCIRQVRADGSKTAYRALTKGAFDSDPIAQACRRSRAAQSWTTLLRQQGISEDELRLINSQSIQLAKEKRAANGGDWKRRLSESKKHYTETELLTWADQNVQPLIVQAKESKRPEDYAKLSLTRFRGSREFCSFCLALSGNNGSDWYGALARYGRLGSEEIRAIKRASHQLAASRPTLVVEQRLGPSNAILLRSLDIESSPVEIFSSKPTSRIVVEVTKGDFALSAAQKWRLRTRAEGSSNFWDDRAEELSNVAHDLQTTFRSKVLLQYLLQHSTAETFPQSIFCPLAGTGEYYDQVLGCTLFDTLKIPRPTVTEMDISEVMTRYSRNPNKLVGDALRTSLGKESFDCVICNSMITLSKEQFSQALIEWTRLLKPQGWLILKADNCRFSSEFEKALEHLGYALLAPFNAKLSLQASALDPQDYARAQQALGGCHLIVAQKSLPSGPLPHLDLRLVREATLSEEEGLFRSHSRRIRASTCDAEIACCAQEFIQILRQCSDESLHSNYAIATALLRFHFKKLFLNGEVGPFPEERNDASMGGVVKRLVSLAQSANQDLRESHDEVSSVIKAWLEAAKRLSDLKKAA